IRVPVAVCGENGELLMYNTQFRKHFLDAFMGENMAIQTFLSDHTPEYAVRNGTIDVRYGGKRYTVFAHELKRGFLFEYIDDTYLKNIVDKYNQTKKSVAMMVFDNTEDFADADQEVAAAHLTAENLLYRWANKHNILLRRLGESRYIAVFEERVLVDQISKKFRILDRIRSVTYNGRSATVSIGIGRDCENLTQSAAEAKKALDMALGRGGDQVAILSGGDYQFFGGVAKGVEKTSKVKVRVRSEQIADAIKAADRVLITGHKFSDLDCIGAAAGMYALVSEHFKKLCYICTDTAHTLAKVMIERLSEENPGMFISPEKGLTYANEKTLLIIVDTHSPDFVESDKLYKNCGNVIIIDHHRRMVNYIDKASVFLHEPSASSASELVTEIIEYLADDVVSHVQAEALLAGIMLDTKNFVINTGVRSFEAAAYLRKKGADTVVVRNVFANSLQNYRDKSRLVSSAQIYKHCAITVAEQPIQNSRVVCAQAADDLLSIEDTYASFVISTIDIHSVNISARSFGKLNVQVLMEKLGGGGHQTMAAAQLVGVSLKEAKEQLMKVLEESLD
ncbi:MAG: DHH family phosphoesterase, partial [Ruminococcus sp.]|nr:DHH family phosphoesterase [Ruminococcus sp.]